MEGQVLRDLKATKDHPDHPDQLDPVAAQDLLGLQVPKESQGFLGHWVLRGLRETKDHRAQLALMGPPDNRVRKDLRDPAVLQDQQVQMVRREPQELPEIRDHQVMLSYDAINVISNYITVFR